MKKIIFLTASVMLVAVTTAQVKGDGSIPKTSDVNNLKSVQTNDVGNKAVISDESNKNTINKNALTNNLSSKNINDKTTGQPVFTIEKSIAVTPVKNQAMTGSCWCFSTTSLVESQCLGKKLGEFDLSEMYTVRNIYLEKAMNYILRQTHAQFGEGGLGHDLIRAIATYGAVPESFYSGLKNNQKLHNHVRLVESLKRYLDSISAVTPISADWMKGFQKILDTALGVPPENFDYNGKKYTPQTFAKEVLKFNADDYVNITSFKHHPYYEPYIIEVPDNFSNGSYYNLPLDEMIELTKDALERGYSVLWDADVRNKGFMQNHGIAIQPDSAFLPKNWANFINGSAAEMNWNDEKRQELYENLTTQDVHLMHITGLERGPNGKTYFLVKNSWGDIGPYHGYINVSEAYFAINTISLIIPKAAFSKALLDKLKIK